MLACCWSLAHPGVAAADARSEYLIRLLSGSTQFRVRAQAAISLGGVEASSSAVDALMSALSDEHPAVRAAAANSLGRLGDAKALRVLRAKSSDPEPPVQQAVKVAIAKLESAQAKQTGEVEIAHGPSGPPRFYVAIGKPGTRLPEISTSDLTFVQQTLRQRVGEMDGVVIASGEETPTVVRNVLKARKLKGYYIDSAVTSVTEKPGGGVRVAVSVIVATYPDRAMRAIMQGAATAMGGSDAKAQAVAGALRSALGQLPQAMSRD
jgi:hypothetical protein